LSAVRAWQLSDTLRDDAGLLIRGLIRPRGLMRALYTRRMEYVRFRGQVGGVRVDDAVVAMRTISSRDIVSLRGSSTAGMAIAAVPAPGAVPAGAALAKVSDAAGVAAFAQIHLGLSGGADLVVLQATAAGEPVYRKIGFEAFTHYGRYVSPGPLERSLTALSHA
jgi:hypothetical protein